MDSRLLEYFLRVAEMGSINRAASALHLSQPALSRHMAALEHEMGAALFTRTQGGVHLTEPGRVLADRARPLLRQFSGLREEVSESAAGQLTLGVPPSWRQVFTAAFLQGLMREHPELKLRVHEAVSHALRDLLLGGSLDLCLIPFDRATATGLHQLPLVREPIIVVGDASRRFVAERPMTVTQLAQERLVLPARPNVLRMQVEQACKRRHLQARIALETDNLLLCLDLARDGAGVTAVPACAMSGAVLPDPTLRWTPVRGLWLSWALYENTARSHAPPVREARRRVLSTLKRTLAAGQWFGAEALAGLREPDEGPAALAAGQL